MSTFLQKITSNLWFDHQAEEAAKYYTSIFKNSGIGREGGYWGLEEYLDVKYVSIALP